MTYIRYVLGTVSYILDWCLGSLLTYSQACVQGLEGVWEYPKDKVLQVRAL